MSRTRRLILTALLSGMLFAPSAARAAAPDGAIRVFATRFEPTGEFTGAFDFGGGALDTTIEAESTTGLAIGWEIGINPRIGLQAELMIVDFDFVFSAGGLTTDFGSATAIPFAIALQWHLSRSERFDVYAGPLLAYTLWGDLESEFGVASLDAAIDLGVRAGIDVSLSDSWALAARLDYLTAAAEDRSASLDVNPIAFGLGLAHRY